MDLVEEEDEDVRMARLLNVQSKTDADQAWTSWIFSTILNLNKIGATNVSVMTCLSCLDTFMDLWLP